MPPVALLDAPDHVRGIEAVDQLIHGPGLPVRPFDMDDRRHLADVEVHADKQGLSRLYGVEAGIQLPVVGVVDRPGVQVDELAVQVRQDQLGWIRLHQRRDVVRRQVQLVVERAGLDQAIHALQGRLLAQLLHELLVDELEPLGGRRHIHAVLQSGHVVAHPGNDLAPGVFGLQRGQHIEFVDQGVADLEAHDGLRLLH
ncbi:hypothetical protein D3C79_722840 [compost metagenome]